VRRVFSYIFAGALLEAEKNSRIEAVFERSAGESHAGRYPACCMLNRPACARHGCADAEKPESRCCHARECALYHGAIR